MDNYPLFPFYFDGLYPPEEQDKINLYSRDFYNDALEFYCKKGGEDERKKLVQGIKYLSDRIKLYDELIDVMAIWDSVEKFMFLKIAFYEQKPNLVKEFRTTVENILDAKREKLFQRMQNELKERKGLREEIKNDKIIINSLITNKKATRKIPSLTGFRSSLDDTQIESLYNQMNNNYIETSPENFNGIFKDEPLPRGCSIKWIDTGITRHEPNKQTLYEFLYLLKEHGYLDKSNFDTLPTNENNLYRKLETIFPNIKNFSNSNPQSTQRKTPRQKELEKIILTLKS